MKNKNNFLRICAMALLPILLVIGCTELPGLNDDYNDENFNDQDLLTNPFILNSLCEYVILAKSGISTVPNSDITGNIGVSPIAQTAITGFALTDGVGFATSEQVSGFVFAADQQEPTPSKLTVAITEMEETYTKAADSPNPVETEFNNGELGGEVFLPGVYKWSTIVTASSDFTLSGNEDDVWIFQIADNLNISSDVTLTLSGGALASNIYWQVAGAATIGTNANFAGIILSKTAIHLQTGATHIGKLLAQTAVTLDQNTITDSGCSEPSDDNGDGDDADEIGDFGLLNPVNDCQSLFSCPKEVVFNWETAASELAVTYYVLIDTLGGNFNNPLATELSDDDGSKTSFTVNISYISDFLIARGVAKGDKVPFIWKVKATVQSEDVINKFSKNVFILNMIRCDVD